MDDEYQLAGHYRVSHEFRRMAERRVRPLLTGPGTVAHRTLNSLLAEAYALGLSDAVDITRREGA